MVLLETAETLAVVGRSPDTPKEANSVNWTKSPVLTNVPGKLGFELLITLDPPDCPLTVATPTATPVEETQSAAKVPPTPVTPSSVAYKDCTSEIE